MDDSKIVEIYTAANNIEAHTIANALEDAGIKVQVVGDFLDMAAGGLPLGQPISPSVWVLREDEARARKLLEEYETLVENRPETSDSEELETEDLTSEEIGEPSEDASESPPGRRSGGFISPLLALAGIAAISMGVFYASMNHNLLHCYSKTVEAQFVKYNYDADKSRNSNADIYYFFYAYKVGDDRHTATTESHIYPGKYITIRYNPQNPADYYVDPILHPIWCLVLGGIFGGFALFLAYQFRE